MRRTSLNASASAISATPLAIGSAAFVIVTDSKTSSATRDLTSPPQCAISFTRGPNISAVRNGECHVVISTSAFAISLRNSGESSCNADFLQLVTSASFCSHLSVKKCWNKTSLANARTFGRVTSISKQMANRIAEVRQCNLRFFDFRMPVLLPFKTDVTVVFQISDRDYHIRKRYVTADL